MTAIFLYGTLRDVDLRRIVLGEDVRSRPARLRGHRIARASDGDWPTLVAGEGSGEGLLAEVSRQGFERIAHYEAGFGYAPSSARVETDSGDVAATVFRSRTPEAATDEEWDLSGWQGRWGALTRRTALAAMDAMGKLEGPALHFAMPTMRMRAHSAIRAEQHPDPHTLRTATRSADVEVVSDTKPYIDYFAVKETRLRHPLFGGGTSDELKRAAFLAADAVTVLPYDPSRDRVMLVEQFRFGPYGRGDPYPWALEPIAGRIDPGETPEETARREAREEAGLEIGALHHVARYYPSPGALTEHLESYVGVADLPDGAEGVGGLEEEHEDIRAHVLPFARLMELVVSGEANTGPLVLTALWLERERKAGRFA